MSENLSGGIFLTHTVVGAAPPKSPSKRRLHYTVVVDLQGLFAYRRLRPAASCFLWSMGSDLSALCEHGAIAIRLSPCTASAPLFIVCRCCLFDEANTGRMTWGLTPIVRRDVTGTVFDAGDKGGWWPGWTNAITWRPSSVRLSVNILRKSLLLPDKWLDRDQTRTRWSPDGPASRVCSRSRSRSYVTW